MMHPQFRNNDEGYRSGNRKSAGCRIPAFRGGMRPPFGSHGSVQNMPDGSVRIIAEGSPASLEEFALLVWAHGEPGIRVDGLQALQGEATGEFKGFWVKW